MTSQEAIKLLNETSKALLTGSAFQRQEGESLIDNIKRCRKELELGLKEAREVVEGSATGRYIEVKYEDHSQAQALVSLMPLKVLPIEAAEVLNLKLEKEIVFPSDVEYYCSVAYIGLKQTVGIGVLSACGEYSHEVEDRLSIRRVHEEKVVYRGTLEVCTILQAALTSAYKEGRERTVATIKECIEDLS